MLVGGSCLDVRVGLFCLATIDDLLSLARKSILVYWISAFYFGLSQSPDKHQCEQDSSV